MECCGRGAVVCQDNISNGGGSIISAYGLFHFGFPSLLGSHSLYVFLMVLDVCSRHWLGVRRAG